MKNLIFFTIVLSLSSFIFCEKVPSTYTYLNQIEFETNSTDSSCDYAVSITSILLGICEYVSPSYQQTVCTGSSVQVYNCSDSACNHCVLLTQTPANKCSPSSGYSMMYTCTNSIPKLNANDVITYQTYSDNQCGSHVIQSSSILANYCFGHEEYQEYSCSPSTGQAVALTCTDPQCSQNCSKNFYNMNCVPFTGGGSMSVSCT